MLLLLSAKAATVTKNSKRRNFTVLEREGLDLCSYSATREGKAGGQFIKTSTTTDFNAILWSRMRFLMRRIRLVSLLATVFCVGSAAAQETCRFDEFPAKIYTGQRAGVSLATAEAKRFRTRIRATQSQPINFAGKHVLTTWGAGEGCVTGAAVNAETGASVFLPFTACNSTKADGPLEFRKDSRLLVVRGQIREGSQKGLYYFEFNGSNFKNLGPKGGFLAALFGNPEEKLDEIEPAAGSDQATTSAEPRFDANGNLSPDASRIFFENIKDSLVRAVGNHIYLRAPFPDIFMSTGYFRREGDFLLFINPTFGTVVLIDVPSRNINALGVTELFFLTGEEPKGEKSQIHARFIHLNTYVNKIIQTYRKNPDKFREALSNEESYRDTKTNISFISSPILRSANNEVKSCYNDFSTVKYTKILDASFEAFSGYKESLNMMPVDLVPMPEDSGMLILTDMRSRALYALVPLKKEAGKCKFFAPTFILQD